MYKGSLVTIEDLSNGQIEDILDLAQEIEEDRSGFYGLASRRIMASLFLEPSTRTRGSFEAAMKRLGGDTITTADARSSSMEKGESLADTIRVWSGYSDLIVLRHPWEGAARLAAEYSDVPVINAGDGSHEHPTQTLLDLYTLRKEFGTLEGRKIVLCGDLKHGRTVHSLTYALVRFGAEITFMHGEDLELPEHVKHRIEAIYGRALERLANPGHLMALYGMDAAGHDGGHPVDALYITPSQPHMRALYEDSGGVEIEVTLGKTDAIYITRMQRERDLQDTSGGDLRKLYPKATRRSLAGERFKRTLLLHPLPRVDELSPELDSDSRSKYFEQARHGVPVRMALIALILGLKPWRHRSEQKDVPLKGGVPDWKPGGISCANPICATQKEPQNTSANFTYFSEPRVRLVCGYCEREALPAFFRYPEGGVYRPIEEYPPALDPNGVAFFMDDAAALASGLSLRQRRLLNHRRLANG